MVLRILHPILLHILPLSAFENAHREPRIREYRTIVDRDRELCTKASISRRTASPLTDDDIGGVRVLSSFVFLDTPASSH